MTIGEKRVRFYDRMLTLTAIKRPETGNYTDLLFKYYYWRLKTYGFASGKSGLTDIETARYVLRKMSAYYARLSRTDI